MPEETAVQIAALRALGSSTPRGSRVELERALASLGRTLIDTGDEWTLGWDAAIDPRSVRITVRELSPFPLVVLAVVIGLCWRDRSGPLCPGEGTSVSAVMRSMAELGASEATHRQFISAALQHDLGGAGLVRVRGNRISLGPALAVWSEQEVEALRRSADLLPEAPDDA